MSNEELEEGVDIAHQDGKTYRPVPGQCRFGDYKKPMLPCAFDSGKAYCGINCFCSSKDRPDYQDVVWELQK